MRSRLVMLTAIVIGAVAVVFAVSHVRSSSAGSRVPAAHASLPPRLASYLGVYENGAPPGYAPVADFAAAAGRAPNLVGYFSGWIQPFAAPFARQVRARGGVITVQIDPTDASVAGIAAGEYDSYLRSFADSVRDFGHPVVVGFGHEMNARWYPWGYTHVPARTFVGAWRHIVRLFRSQGADNVTWLWTVNADLASTGPLTSWWPGAAYVSWVGIDGYFYRPADTFATVFGPTLRQVRALTGKPVLLSETAVGPSAGQAVKIRDLFSGMAKARTLGLVWFDNTQDHGIYHQDWRIEDSPAAAAAFRLGVRDELVAPAH
jgi:mannan endo-1,4-beta-mannosidase